MARRQAGELLDQLVERLKTEGKVTEAVRAPRKWGIPLKPIARTTKLRSLSKNRAIASAGASACLTKDQELDDIVEAIKSAAA